MRDEDFEVLADWQIEHAASEFAQVFGRVRPSTENDFCAAFVAHELMEAMDRQAVRMVKDENDGRATEVQLLQLKQLGVRRLKDLSKEQAEALLKMPIKEKGRKEKEWY